MIILSGSSYQFYKYRDQVIKYLKIVYKYKKCGHNAEVLGAFLSHQARKITQVCRNENDQATHSRNSGKKTPDPNTPRSPHCPIILKYVQTQIPRNKETVNPKEHRVEKETLQSFEGGVQQVPIKVHREVKVT